MKASDEQIDCFMKFRDKDWLEKELLKCRNDGDRGRTMQRVANSAALYKGILYEERFRKWGDDHFRLKIPHKYPHVGRHWNGWSSFWIETSPGIRIMFTATVAIIVEHVVNGFILPMFYLFTLNPVYYNLALYGEVAFMMYATILLAASYVLGRDYSLEQMDKAVWHLLLLHHIASLMLCVACILVCGETTPKDLVCYVLLALLGLTSSLHYVGIIMDLGPLSLVDSPRIRMGHHIICMLSQICFRGPFWLKVVYLIYLFIIDVHGAGVILVAVVSAFLLLTAFNADFIKYHIKATMGNIREISVLKKK